MREHLNRYEHENANREVPVWLYNGTSKNPQRFAGLVQVSKLVSYQLNSVNT